MANAGTITGDDPRGILAARHSQNSNRAKFHTGTIYQRGKWGASTNKNTISAAPSVPFLNA
jgi:hypothetical protein